MNHSDLEEGEILDDPPSLFHPIKRKELPRRYVILDSPKHRKNCKYAIRHHAKKLSKLKKTPIRMKVAHKSRHKLSCDKIHKSSCSSSPVSDGVFKDYSIVSPNAKKSRKIQKSEKVNILKESSFAQMLEKYKAMQSSKNSNNFVNSSKPMSNSLVKSIEGLASLEKECEEITKDTCSGVAPPSPEIIIIEDEDDEEELRRIALATCAKRVLTSEKLSENSSSNLDCKNISVPQSTSPLSNLKNDNKVADNYEVVDMEVDQDEDNSPDTTNNLFVIDTKPSSGFQDGLQFISEQKASDDDSDFETDMLRAELINVMFQQNKSTSDELINPITPDIKLHKKEESSDKQVFPENSKPQLDRASPLVEEIKPVKRFIISLYGESSSDEYEDEDNKVNALPENPVASIEALISGIRQQSDCSKKDNKEVVPKAVSCLSKAQQEEYNALMKILTEKKRNVHLSQDESEVKNKDVHSPMDDLKLYEKKLMRVKEDLKRQKDLMSGLSKQVTEKKQVYLKAKLNVKSIKEKLVAADKVRRLKLDAWSKSCSNFESVKKSVSDLELKIFNLQNLCSKVGSSIQGQNYSLPSVTET